MKTILTWALGFVTENMPQSSARAIALMCGTMACLCAPFAIYFAFTHPANWQTTAAIGGTTVTALGGVVSVALAVRKKNDPVSEDKG